MKVLCKVNNYQYGMSAFKSIREQYFYKDELIGNLHYVYLQFEKNDINVSWLTKLLNGRVYPL